MLLKILKFEITICIWPFDKLKKVREKRKKEK